MHKIFLTNTLSRKKEEFHPLKKGHTSLYTCGPTVYWFQHIGNMRAYITWDLLRRMLTLNGLDVKHVMNYTDVGHLTSDADSGEDKMEQAAAKEGKSAHDIASFYAHAFEKDCVKLNLLKPTITCKATEHIKEQIELVEILENKGFTYKTSDGIYFDTSKDSDYGKLGKNKLEDLEEGKRVDMGEKRNKSDFALWKFSEKQGVRQQEWESPWGVGFPGWHIECSAMSLRYLGNQFDIHTGGEDHIQVHHENEIAQTECATGIKPWVNYWLHVSFLTFKGEKVSKSKGGLYTITELEEQGFEPITYRYFCLGTHYRKQLGFSIEALTSAKNAYDRLKNIIFDLRKKEDSKNKEHVGVYITRFIEAINDDLNTPNALAVLWDALQDKELGSVEKLQIAYEFDEVLGLGFEMLSEVKDEVPENILELARKREDTRANKNWTESDKIRDELLSLGWIVEDKREGQTLRKA